MCQKGTKDTILMSYPGTELRDKHWERRIFEILEFTKGTNSGYHATVQKKFEYFSCG